MIHPQELRIGNIVLKTSTGNQHFLSPNDITNFAHSVLMRPMFEPIPLTEEWLIKFGFKKEFHYFFIGEFFIFVNMGSVVGLPIGAFYTEAGRYVIELKYVHKAQNVFYEFGGSELTIKE